MSLVDVVALVLFLGVTLYACFGGADFGVGIWDLTAGGDRRGGALRTLIDHSIGPVWEANHVWLIFVLVYLWTGFPDAFALIASDLWVPLSLAALGIVLRGSAFAFRKFAPSMTLARTYGILFALSSIITPFFFGAVAGAVASGNTDTWTSTSSLIGGTVAVFVCSFLAAVLLTHEATKERDADLFDECRKRAIGSAIATGMVVLAGLGPLRHDAPVLFHGLTHKALVLVIASTICGLTTLALLLRRNTNAARFMAFGSVASVVAGWGVAQYPWAVVDRLTLDAAAGARPTLVGLLIVFAIAAVTVVPSLAYLYTLFQKPLHVTPGDAKSR